MDACCLSRLTRGHVPLDTETRAGGRTESVDAYTLATVDMHVFLHREHAAFAKFSTAWAAAAEEEEGEEREEEVAGLRAAARQHETAAAGILATMEKYLWSESDGRYIGRH